MALCCREQAIYSHFSFGLKVIGTKKHIATFYLSQNLPVLKSNESHQELYLINIIIIVVFVMSPCHVVRQRFRQRLDKRKRPRTQEQRDKARQKQTDVTEEEKKEFREKKKERRDNRTEVEKKETKRKDRERQTLIRNNRTEEETEEQNKEQKTYRDGLSTTKKEQVKQNDRKRRKERWFKKRKEDIELLKEIDEFMETNLLKENADGKEALELDTLFVDAFTSDV